MSTARDTFLENCDPEDRATYQTLFAELETLGREMGDPEPNDESKLESDLRGLPLRLRIAFEDRIGASLKLEHAKLRKPAALLWFFPSRGVAAASTASRVSAMLPHLREVGVPEEDIVSYATDLGEAGFIDGGEKTLKNRSAGEPAGVDRTFRWPAHRAALLQAIRKLVARLNGKVD